MSWLSLRFCWKWGRFLVWHGCIYHGRLRRLEMLGRIIVNHGSGGAIVASVSTNIGMEEQRAIIMRAAKETSEAGWRVVRSGKIAKLDPMRGLRPVQKVLWRRCGKWLLRI